MLVGDVNRAWVCTSLHNLLLFWVAIRNRSLKGSLYIVSARMNIWRDLWCFLLVDHACQSNFDRNFGNIGLGGWQASEPVLPSHGKYKIFRAPNENILCPSEVRIVLPAARLRAGFANANSYLTLPHPSQLSENLASVGETLPLGIALEFRLDCERIRRPTIVTAFKNYVLGAFSLAALSYGALAIALPASAQISPIIPQFPCKSLSWPTTSETSMHL